MSLVFGPSAIEFSKISPDYYYVGVGPYIRIYKNDFFIAEHLIFPITTRIVGITEKNRYVIAYASNILKILSFNSNFNTYNEIKSEEFEDYILSASINDEQTSEEIISLSIVLHHGQFCRMSDKILIHQPKVWKIVTSAFIVNYDMFISGDSFGCISIILPDSQNEIMKETSYGTVFGLDFNKENHQILAAFEYRACGLFKFVNNKITTIWISQDYPSRVWGCKILPIGPISFGEDGCIHLIKSSNDQSDNSNTEDIQNYTFHLHRIKNITALASRGDEVITAGQNCLLRHFTLFDKQPDIVPYNILPLASDSSVKDSTKKKKDPLTPFSLAIAQNGEVIIGTLGGSIISLPSRREMLVGDKYKKWYLMQSYQNIIFGASESHHHYLLQIISKKNQEGGIDNEYLSKVFEFPNNCSAWSLAISKNFLVAAYSDNNIRIYDFDGIEKISLSISDYIKKPPKAMCAHLTKPIICFGSHSARVVVLCFSDDLLLLNSSFLIQSASTDGFRGMVFCGDYIYCAGRTDGTVSILGECQGEWRLKSSWRIAAQCKATAGIDSINNDYFQNENENKDHLYSERPIVSVFTKEGIALWDIETQTMVSQNPLISQSDKLSIKFTSNKSYSVAWIEKSIVHVQSDVPSIPAFSTGVSFHGLRGLCMDKLIKGNDDLIATGGCDRDVKLWRIINGEIRCVESLQAVDSGTHAVCFHEKDSLLFAGGSKEYLYVWKLTDDDKLFRLNIFEVGDNNKIYKLRVTSMTLTSERKLFIGMSDASIRVYDYSLTENNLKFIEKIDTKGVPVSCNCTRYGDKEVVSVSTSTGDAYWFFNDNDIKKYTQKLLNCGIHCIRSFAFNDLFYSVIAGDDGTVRIWNLEHKIDSDFNMIECLNIQKSHAGGAKALAIEVHDNEIKILSFSYDQKAIIYIIDLKTFNLIRSIKYLVSVPDGISCEFVKDGFVVFGFAIQYFNTLYVDQS